MSSRILSLAATLLLASLGAAQDPIPVAYWSHPHRQQWGQPGVNAFTPPMPYYYYQGPQLSIAPYGCPETGVRTPFFIPACAPNCGHGHGFGRGMFAGHGGGSGGPPTLDSVPMHPYARSPRDFFMFYENLEAERSRDLRPTLIP